MNKNESGSSGHNAGRRDFLKMGVLGAPVAVAAATVGTDEAAAAIESETRMQDTPHTRAYFESAKF